MTDKAELRAADADREQVTERLRGAAAEGRIGLDELDERLDRAYAAKTYGELDAVVADLPGDFPAGDFPAGTGGDQDVLRLKSGAGDVRQEGYWVVPPKINAKCGMGNVRIDFTQAECRHRDVSIDVECGMGSVLIVVPRGWWVRTDEVFTAYGSVRNKPKETPDPDAVRVRVSGTVTMGSVRVRYRPRRGPAVAPRA